MKRHQKRGRRTKDLRKLAEDKIRACGTCMPGNGFDYADELFSKLRLTRSERERLSKNLYCPNCEIYLEPHHSIVFYTEEEEQHFRRQASWDTQYRSQFDKFQDFLVKYPSLGGLHTIGEQLARAIKRARVRALEPGIWYRARGYEENKQLTADDFFPPTPQRHRVSVGRYNNAGQRAYYLGDSPATVAVETLRDRKADDGKIWIARIELLEPIRVLDLRFRILGEEEQQPLLLYGLLYAGKINEEQKPSDLSNPPLYRTKNEAEL
jgi:RES domain-containing protein